MAHIELRVNLKHDLPAGEMHTLAIDTLMKEFQVTDDLGVTVLNPSYLGQEDDIPDRPRSVCGCGYDIVWTPEGWQHDAAPYFWGDDHDIDEPEPSPSDAVRKYWDEQDGVLE